jgi:hypothetical protein
MKFDIRAFFENLSRKIQVSLHSNKNNGTLHDDKYRFFIISRSILLRMRNVSVKSYRQNQNTQFMFNNPPPPPENRRVYEIMWKKYCRAGQATDDNMAHAHCVLDI